MRAKSRKTEVLELITDDLKQKDLVFLYRLVRAFSEFGLSIKVKKQTFLIFDDVIYHIYFIFDTKKFRASTKNRPKRKTVVLSAERIRERMNNGETADEIAADFGVGRATLFRYLRKAEADHTGE